MGGDWSYLMEDNDITHRILEADKIPPLRLSYTAAKVQLNISKPTLIKVSKTIKTCPLD